MPSGEWGLQQLSLLYDRNVRLRVLHVQIPLTDELQTKICMLNFLCTPSKNLPFSEHVNSLYVASGIQGHKRKYFRPDQLINCPVTASILLHVVMGTIRWSYEWMDFAYFLDNLTLSWVVLMWLRHVQLQDGSCNHYNVVAKGKTHERRSAKSPKTCQLNMRY